MRSNPHKDVRGKPWISKSSRWLFLVKEKPQCTKRIWAAAGVGDDSAGKDCAGCKGAGCGCTHLQPKMEDEEDEDRDAQEPATPGMQDDPNKGHTHSN